MFGADLDQLDGRELAERLQGLERLARRIEREIVQVVAAADRRAVWSADGHRMARGWCRATVNWSGAETMHRVRSAALVDAVPAAGAAIGAGEIGVAQLRELARARSNPRCRNGSATSPTS